MTSAPMSRAADRRRRQREHGPGRTRPPRCRGRERRCWAVDFMMVPGGKGANQAIAAVRAGGACIFLGAIGSDSFGVTLASRLRVRCDTALRWCTAVRVAVVMVDAAGENSIVATPGANALVGLVMAELVVIAGADVLVAQLEVPVESVTAAMRPPGRRTRSCSTPRPRRAAGATVARPRSTCWSSTIRRRPR